MAIPEHLTEEQIQELALSQARGVLPDGWTVETIPQSPAAIPGGEAGSTLLVAQHNGLGGTAAPIEVRKAFTPLDARRLLADSLRATTNSPILIIAPYLSPRARKLLEGQRIGYIDLTGNVHLDLQGLFVHIERTNRNPSPAPTRTPGLTGASGGRVVRVLIDARPPYGVTDIAIAAGVDTGYASRILDGLNEEALIDRAPRGKVTDADWPALLRTRARHLDLLNRRAANTYVARQGARQALTSLAENPPDGLWAVTGSFAASQIAPVTAPALLVVYAMDPKSIASELGLLPADEGADVVVIRPSNCGPFDRPREVGGVTWAGLSQVVLDCLSGNGRMPAEGEALIDWMAEHEQEWRLDITALPPPAGKA
jgi:hypothetical protein